MIDQVFVFPQFEINIMITQNDMYMEALVSPHPTPLQHYPLTTQTLPSICNNHATTPGLAHPNPFSKHFFR